MFSFFSGYVLAMCQCGYGPTLECMDLDKMNLIVFDKMEIRKFNEGLKMMIRVKSLAHRGCLKNLSSHTSSSILFSQESNNYLLP